MVTDSVTLTPTAIVFGVILVLLVAIAVVRSIRRH